VGPSQVCMLPRTQRPGSTLDCLIVHCAAFTARSGEVDFVWPSRLYLFTVSIQWNFTKTKSGVWDPQKCWSRFKCSGALRHGDM
jgi:hypothetical protein